MGLITVFILVIIYLYRRYVKTAVEYSEDYEDDNFLKKNK